MSGTFPSIRIAFVLLSVALVSAVYLGITEQPNKAQRRAASAPPQPTAKFAQFAKSDEVTNDIRDRSKEIVRVQLRSINDKEKATKYGRIVEDFGSFVVIAKNKSADMSRSGLEVQKMETTVHLPGAKFDPVDAAPVETVRPGEGGIGEKEYFVVQVGAIAKDEWLESIRDAGVEVLQYVPHQAFFVYGDRNAIAKVATHSRVRWTGRYSPEQKKSPETARFIENVKGDKAMFDVAVFGRADLQEVSGKVLGAIRGRVLHQIKLPNNYFNVVRIEANVGDIDEIAKIPDVIRVDQYEKPQPEDERSSQIISGNFTSSTVLNAPGYNPLTQFGVNGQGVTISMVDDGVTIPVSGGFYVTAANTVHGPLRGGPSAATGGHGHINASIISGDEPFSALDPTGYNYGVGVAPKSNIINIPMLTTAYSGSESDSYNDTVITPGPNGVLGSISNNSWGNGLNANAYDSYTAQFDGFVQDASAGPNIDPITLVFSAGNSGPGAGTLTRPKAAKNLIAVGNSENVRTEILGASADNLDDLRGSSSRGPTLDGRIKPDITAPGTAITGSRAGNGGSVSGQVNEHISYSSGTSHAAPQVAGAAALFTQYWKNNFGGSNPSPALIKAAVINSGQEMNGLTTNTAMVPNGIEGWGRLSMKNMFNVGFPIAYVNQNIAFSSPGDNVSITGNVIDPSKPVRFTLVWTDPPGAGTPALVNNLDLTVTVGANIYRGNVFSGGVSVTGGSNSTIDNVENVYLASGVAAGTPVSIAIGATALNGNGILGNADSTDQHFALVAYNFAPTQPGAAAPVDFDGDDKTDLSIFRPTGGEWWINRSTDNTTTAFQFGAATDRLVPADYTGDGKADIALWRPSTGQLYVLRSEDSSFYAVPFGISTDIFVPADYDADNKADAAVFRPASSTWYIAKSGGGTDIIQFGIPTDIPIPADYDGDDKVDIAIFRPIGGEWWINRSTGGVLALQFGAATDRLVPGDYTGDGKADIAFWRPVSGDWYVLRSEDSSFFAVPFGAATDLPVPGDYDGDGKFDRAVFRPSSATWYVDRSTAGILIRNFGIATDTPLPYAYVR